MTTPRRIYYTQTWTGWSSERRASQRSQSWVGLLYSIVCCGSGLVYIDSNLAWVDPYLTLGLYRKVSSKKIMVPVHEDLVEVFF